MAKTEPPPQKQYLIDPIYRSSLVYRPSDYVSPKKFYDDDDLESQKEDERSILADNYAARRSRRRRRCSMCCCSLCYLILILLIVAAIVVVKLIPKDPELSLGQLNIIEFVHTESSSNNGQQLQQMKVELSYNLNVTNRNPHADAIYQNISLSLLFNNVSLGSFNSTPAQFEQKRKSTTPIVADLPEQVTTIQDAVNAANLKSQAASQNVQVELTGDIRGTFKVLGVKVKKFDKGILCKLNIKPGDGGSTPASLLTTVCYS